MTTPREDPDSPPGKSISGPTQMQQRINAALEIILVGGSTYDLARLSRQEGWGVTERQLQTYMSRARVELGDVHRLDRLEIITEHVAVRKRLFNTCVTTGEVAVALAVYKDLGELQGVYPPKVTKQETGPLTPAPSTPGELTDDELTELHAELVREVQARQRRKEEGEGAE